MTFDEYGYLKNLLLQNKLIYQKELLVPSNMDGLVKINSSLGQPMINKQYVKWV